MDTTNSVIKSAIRTLQAEADALTGLQRYVNISFKKTIDLILNTKGRLIISGIGKSALVGQKIVATLNSTGTPSLFMHAADAIHGDLGMVLKDDIVMLISQSGNTPEVKVLIPLLKASNTPIIAITGDENSYLALQADFVINSYVEKEACPMNLAPTTSSTAQIALGDAIAVCLMEARSFSATDFAKYHPGGALGKRLYLRTEDLVDIKRKPSVKLNTPLRDALIEISDKRYGATIVLEEGKIIGIVTDGDIRRMLQNGLDVNTTTVAEIMHPSPETIEKSELAAQALEKMRAKNITQLVVTDQGVYYGIVHLHDLLKEGII